MSSRIYQRLAQGFLSAHPYVVAESDALVSILSACTPRELAAGERLCEEGDPGIELYFLLRGAIRVLKANPSGGHTLLGTVEAPALLGQMAILDRTRRSATCVAVDTALVVVMDQPSFGQTIRSTGSDGHTLRRLLLSSLTRQLVHSNARLRSLTTDRSGQFVPADPSAAEVQMQRARAMLEVQTETQTPVDLCLEDPTAECPDVNE